jgi:hypothetical protein
MSNYFSKLCVEQGADFSNIINNVGFAAIENELSNMHEDPHTSEDNNYCL